MSHTDLADDKRLDRCWLHTFPSGGYGVTDGSDVAAFSTLPEALAWLQRNMKQLPREKTTEEMFKDELEAKRHLDAAREVRRRRKDALAALHDMSQGPVGFKRKLDEARREAAEAWDAGKAKYERGDG